MRAKLIWHSVAVWSQKKQSSLQKAQLIVYGVSYFIICETNNSDGKTFKSREFAQNGCVDTADVRSNRMIVSYFVNWNRVCQMKKVLSTDYIFENRIWYIVRILGWFLLGRQSHNTYHVMSPDHQIANEEKIRREKKLHNVQMLLPLHENYSP